MAQAKKIIKPQVNVVTEKPVFSWQSPEFIRYKKDHKWTVYLILTAIVLASIFGFLGMWTSVALVVVAGAVLLVLSGTHPKKINCAVYAEGIVVDSKVYNFTSFKSFWVSFGDLTKIKFQMAGRLGGVVVMPLGDEDPEQIRLFVGKHLPEEEDKGEDLGEMINRIMRF